MGEHGLLSGGNAVVTAYATLVGVVVAIALVVLVEATGRSRLARHLATGAGAVCLVLFVAVNVSDWPGGLLTRFWSDHAIVGATVGTLLLAATVFLIYRYRDQQRQDAIDETIVDAGRSGLVERLVDLDVACSLLVASNRPRLLQGWEWERASRGLSWLRDHLDAVCARHDGGLGADDPRLVEPAPWVGPAGWRTPLLDQMVRRASAGVSEWGPVLMRSRQGQQDLVAFASLRVVLLHVREALVGEDVDTRPVVELQHVLRKFAWVLEKDGEAPSCRPELLEPDWGRSVRPWAWASDDEQEPVRRLLLQVEDHVDRRWRTVAAESRPADRAGRSLLRRPAPVGESLLAGIAVPAGEAVSP